MREESDETVWQRTLSGDEAAFGFVWDRHHERVFRSLLREGNTPHDAEDLCAAAFLELWRKRAAVRFVDGSLLPWLIVTARNVSRNAARATRRYRRFLDSLPAADHAPDHAELIADDDDVRLRRLRTAISGCRPADAALLTLTAVEGFSVRESAEVVGISESAAKMRLSRLRARLRIDMEADMVGEGELR